jgi:WD40 repeat protein
MLGGCKDNNPVEPADSSKGKPAVSIISPAGNYNAVDSVSIEADASDDKGIVKVEIYIDNAAGDFRTFYTKPYKYTWNTQSAADGSTHAVYAKAYDADGNSASSDVINITVYRLQPSNLSAKIMSDSLAVLSWKDNSSIETGFDIEQRTKHTQFSVVKSVKPNDTAAALTGPFIADSAYYFRVCAKTAAQNSGYTNIDSAGFTLPAPANLKASVITDTLISLVWEDNSGNETGFVIEQSSDKINFGVVKTIPANSKSALITGIFNSSNDYYFRIKAVSKFNSSSYAVTGAVKIKILPPSDLKIVSVSQSKAKITWKDNCPFDKGVIIERRVNTGAFETLAKTAAGLNYYSDSLLDINNTYSYRIKAYTAYNTSDYIEVLKIEATNAGYQEYSEINAGYNINSVAFSPDGKHIAAGLVNNAIMILNTELSKPERTISGFSAPVTSVAFSHDGLFLAAGSEDNTAVIWRFSDGEVMKRLAGHSGAVSSVSFSPDGNSLISASYDRKLNFWRISDGALLKTLTGHSSSITAAVISPDGDLIASSSAPDENKIKLWRTIDTSFVKDLPDSSIASYSLSFSPGSRYLAAGYANGNIILWNVPSGTFVLNMQGHSSGISSVSFSPDGGKIISGGYDKLIKIWRVNDGNLLYTISGHTDIVKKAVFSPDGKIIASCGFDKTVRLWQLAYIWKAAQ